MKQVRSRRRGNDHGGGGGCGPGWGVQSGRQTCENITFPQFRLRAVKIGQNNWLAAPPLGLATPLWEIVDPPLQSIGSMLPIKWHWYFPTFLNTFC